MLTQQYLNTILHYDQITGDLIWLPRDREFFDSHRSFSMFNGKYAGSIAGSKLKCKTNTYMRLKIGNQNYLCHRLIWIMVHGYEPNQIDHIDGNGLNNRISNLRNATQSDNMKNRKVSSVNTTGIMGVYWYKKNKKWGVIICNNSDRRFLGLYNDFFNACCARKSAEIKFMFHENHGRIA